MSDAQCKAREAGYYASTNTGGAELSRATSSSGLLSKVGLAPATLKISLNEGLLFLHPTPDGEPSNDPVLSGTVTLYLPKKRTLTSLSVRLLGRQDISFGDLRAPESEVSLSKTVGLFESEALEFDKGETRFAFSIIVPSSTPSYERCQHGRVAHTVTAKAKSRGQVGDLRASVGVMLVPNPGGAGSSAPPPGFFHRYEGAAERFGRYSISLQSHHIMVGGLMLLRTHFEPICDVTIHAIRVRLHQHFHVTSPTNVKRTATLPTDKRTIIALDGGSPPNFGSHESLPKGKTISGTPLVRLSSGQPYQMHHLARLLNHDDLRPTTFAHSRSAIRIRHDITVEVVYSEDQIPKMKQTGAELKTLTMTRGLELYSCCSLVDSLTLPSYEANEDISEERKNCLCGYSWQHLLEHSGHGQRLDLNLVGKAADHANFLNGQKAE